MKTTLHITSGDMAGAKLAESGIPGEVLVWHDILYDGPRKPGWPDDDTLHARARFLEASTGEGFSKEYVLEILKTQYARLKTAARCDRVVLWFDACLFDQSMLCHILMCMRFLKLETVDLLCIDAFPGIDPYHGLGQLSPDQLASMVDRRRPFTEEQFRFAERVDRAFARKDRDAFKTLAHLRTAPLSWVPAAVARWIEEWPDEETGMGRLESHVLEAVRAGCETPADIFAFVSTRETPPQYWGDITLWEKINGLADRESPLVGIEGPRARLPQWEGIVGLKRFRVYPLEEKALGVMQ